MVAAADAAVAEVAAVAGLLAAGVAAVDSSAVEVAAAAAGSVAAESVPGSSSARAAWLARVAQVARAAAYPGERAACAKSHDLTAGLTKDSAKVVLQSISLSLAAKRAVVDA